MAALIAALPAQSCIIDAELTACDEQGLPDFRALHFHRTRERELCVWAFDLLYVNGRDLRAFPLNARRHQLERLIYKANKHWLRLSETFDDGVALLTSCDRMGLEGIVSKRRFAPYRSGKCDWIKVKTATWREANKDRHDLFNKPKRQE